MVWALFWLLALILAVVVAAATTRPLWTRRAAAPSRAAHDVAVFKSQLREIDADLARGALTADEAEGARREISRRLLAADAEAQAADAIGAAPEPAARTALLAAAAPIAVGAAVVYLLLGSPGKDGLPLAERSFQTELETAAAARAGAQGPQRAGSDAPPSAAAPTGPLAPPAAPNATPDQGPSVDELLPRLEAAVANRPNDPRGHELLGRLYLRKERYAEAWRALARAIELGGPSEAALMLLPIQGEAMVLAAGGVVSPEAEAVFNRAPQAHRSRYYLGLALLQRGAARAGVQRWAALLDDTEDPELRRALRAQIAAAAMRAGLARGGVEGGSAPPPPAGSASPGESAGQSPGPSQEDVEAASNLSPEDRSAMIGGMLDRLAARLEEQPNDLEGWIRLIRSRRTFGQDEAAAAAHVRAKEVFKDDPGAVARLNRAASEPVPRLRAAPDQ